MMPWTFLQEIKADAVHPKAKDEMHLSKHKLMDRVSQKASVKHLLNKVSEGDLGRALMEFPRIPHMLNQWDEEMKKHFLQKGCPS